MSHQKSASSCPSSNIRGRASAMVVVLVAAASFLASVSPVAADSAVRIGTREGVTDLELEVDEATGNLLAVLRYDTASDDCWSANLSTDNGASWTETYEYCTGQELRGRIGATVVDGILYVAYTLRVAVNSTRLMRLRCSDGEQDPIYADHEVFTAAKYDSTCNVALASNADSFNDRLYLFAVSDNALRFFWSDQDGGAGSEGWNEIATGVTTAMCDILVPSFNENYHVGSGYSPMAAYLDDWDLYLWRYHGTTGAEQELVEPAEPVFEFPGSISAFEDTVAAVYWSYSYDFKACLSDDAGSSYSCEVIGNTDGPFYGDVDARHGNGIATAYAYDADASDACEYRYLQDDGTWSEAFPCGGPEPDAYEPIDIELLPPHSRFSYGMLLVSNDEVSGGAYFVPAPVVFVDDFESGDTSQWSATAP